MTKAERRTEAKDHIVDRFMNEFTGNGVLMEIDNPYTFLVPYLASDGSCVYVQVGITTKDVNGNAKRAPFDFENKTLPAVDGIPFYRNNRGSATAKDDLNE